VLSLAAAKGPEASLVDSILALLFLQQELQAYQFHSILVVFQEELQELQLVALASMLALLLLLVSIFLDRLYNNPRVLVSVHLGPSHHNPHHPHHLHHLHPRHPSLHHPTHP
jgi:hypothetical protein